MGSTRAAHPLPRQFASLRQYLVCQRIGDHRQAARFDGLQQCGLGNGELYLSRGSVAWPLCQPAGVLAGREVALPPHDRLSL